MGTTGESVFGFVRHVDDLVSQFDALATDVDIRRRTSHASGLCQAAKVAFQAEMFHPGEI
jgi:hypothetical protein